MYRCKGQRQRHLQIEPVTHIQPRLHHQNARMGPRSLSQPSHNHRIPQRADIRSRIGDRPRHYNAGDVTKAVIYLRPALLWHISVGESIVSRRHGSLLDIRDIGRSRKLEESDSVRVLNYVWSWGLPHRSDKLILFSTICRCGSTKPSVNQKKQPFGQTACRQSFFRQSKIIIPFCQYWFLVKKNGNL